MNPTSSRPGALARAFHLISKTALLQVLVFALTTEVARAGSATWKPNPTSNDWNTAANWRPRTAPNAPNDTATFATSSITNVMLSDEQTLVDSIVFSPGASAFTLTVEGGVSNSTLALDGVGLVNNSGVEQNFFTTQQYVTGLNFYNQATAGTQTVYTAAETSGIAFYDQTTAGSATFLIKGNDYFEDAWSELLFYDNSTASNGVFIITGASGEDAEGAETYFYDNSSAGNGTFTNTPATDRYGYWGGTTNFHDNSTAGDSVFTNEGGAGTEGIGGLTQFWENSTAANATITCTAPRGLAVSLAR